MANSNKVGKPILFSLISTLNKLGILSSLACFSLFVDEHFFLFLLDEANLSELKIKEIFPQVIHQVSKLGFLCLESVL